MRDNVEYISAHVSFRYANTSLIAYNQPKIFNNGMLSI